MNVFCVALAIVYKPRGVSLPGESARVRSTRTPRHRSRRRGPGLRENFHKDVREPLQLSVVAQKARATMLGRAGQMKGVESREIVIRSDLRGSFPNRDRNRQHSDAWARKECRITREVVGVSGLERSDQTLQTGCVAHGNLLAGDTIRRNPGRDLGFPERILLNQVDHNIRIETDHHGFSRGLFAASWRRRPLSSCSRPAFSISSSTSSRSALRRVSTSSVPRGLSPAAARAAQIRCIICQNGSSLGNSGSGCTINCTRPGGRFSLLSSSSVPSGLSVPSTTTCVALMDFLSGLICLFSAPAFIFPSFIAGNNPNDRTQGRSRRGFSRFASHDDQTDLGRFPATGYFLQELLKPGAKLLDRARGAAGGQGVEQIGGDNVHGDQAGQGRLNPLDQIGVDLLGELFGLQEALDGRLLSRRQEADALLRRGVGEIIEQGFAPVHQLRVELVVDLLEDRQPTGSERLLLGPEVAVRADRRSVQVILDQREARSELRQPGLKLGQGGVGQDGNPSRQLLELVEPGVFEQFLPLLVLVDPEAGFLVQVEIGGLVLVLRLL